MTAEFFIVLTLRVRASARTLPYGLSKLFRDAKHVGNQVTPLP